MTHTPDQTQNAVTELVKAIIEKWRLGEHLSAVDLENLLVDVGTLERVPYDLRRHSGYIDYPDDLEEGDKVAVPVKEIEAIIRGEAA